MKLFGLVLLLLKLFDEAFGDCKNISPLACVFVDIKKSLKEKNWQISIQNFVENRKILESVLAGKSENSQMTFNYKKLDKFPSIKQNGFQKRIKSQKKSYEIDESGILIFDNLTSLSEFNYKTNFTNEGPKEWQFFVYIDKVKASEIKSAISETKVFKNIDWINEEDRSEIINFQYFIIKEKECFVLYTFVWYTQENCGRQQLVEVNRFNKITKKWKNKKFKIDKFDNFFGCKLMFTFSSFLQRMPEIGYNTIKNEFEGFQVDLLVEISKVLNFTVEVVKNYERNVSRRFTPVSLDLEPFMFSNYPMPNSKRHLTEYYYTSATYLAVPSGACFTGENEFVLPSFEPL
jgi:hypothetical protein